MSAWPGRNQLTGAGGSSALSGSAFMTAAMLIRCIAGVTTTVIGFGNVFWVCAALAAVAGGAAYSPNFSGS